MQQAARRSTAVVVALVALLHGFAVPAARAAGPCGALTEVRLSDGTITCTHGDDDHLGDHVAADGGGPAPLRTAPPQCYSDGVDGYRVSVLYVHATDAPNRLGQVVDRIRRDVGQVEAMVVDSAASQRGRRHVRWETEAAGTGCRVRVRSVGVARGQLQDLLSTVKALEDRGYTRTDRRYALYVDHDRYCGIATMPRDDQAGPANAANRRAGYARVDRRCWNRGDTGGYSTMAHELFHSIGAVQPHAPNATSGGHCTDEWDPLCYDDGSGRRTWVRCRSGGGDADIHHRQLDCGADDYFALNPPSGSYLATRWNTANSPYLATTSGYGSGAQERTRGTAVWPAAHGTYRPSSSAAGFDACAVPIPVATRGSAGAAGGIGGLLGDGGGATTRADAGLVDAARDVVARVNELAGFTVLELADPQPAAAPADGTLLVDRATGSEATVRAWTRAGRTSRAVVALPGERASVDVALRPVLEALGLGSVAWGDQATGRLGGQDARGTRVALQHLYQGGCGRPVQLNLNAPGHPSQLEARAQRRTVDLAAGATSAIGLGVEVSAWLRQQRGGTAPRAVICRDDVPADCLAGAGLLTGGGPVMFVPGGPRGELPEAVRAELNRAVPAGGEFVVLGGTAAVSPRVVEQLRAGLPGRTITRIHGADRFATAAAVARVVAPSGSDRVLLARGDNPADATAAAALATRDGLPVLLTASDRLSGPAATWLRQSRATKVVLLGGTAALSPRVARDVQALARPVRVAGATRTSTAVAIARSSSLWGRTAVEDRAAVVGVPGYGERAWQIALASAPVAAHLDAPVTYLAADRVPVAGGAHQDTGEYVAGLVVRGGGTVAATSVVVGERLGGLVPGVAASFHTLLLPALRDRIELVAE